MKSSVFLYSNKGMIERSFSIDNIHLVTRNAGSLTISGPILKCPCSMNFTAAGKCWAIRFRAITTGNLRRQNRLAVILSTNARFSLVGIKPIACLEEKSSSARQTFVSYNFSSKVRVASIRNGS